MSTDPDLIDRLAADARAESHRTVTGPDMPWIRDRAARHRRRRKRVQGLVAAIVLAGVTAGGMWAASRPGGDVAVVADGAAVDDHGDLGRNGPAFQPPVSTAPDGLAQCDRTAVVEGLDVSFVATDEQEITRLEALSGRYSGQPGVRAVVPTIDGRVKLVIDDDAAPELVAEAESDGLEVVTSCVTAADLRAMQSVLATTVEGDDYITFGYSVFTDTASLSTSLPDEQIRAALVQAGIPAERIDSVVAIDIGQAGEIGRLIGGTGSTGGGS